VDRLGDAVSAQSPAKRTLTGFIGSQAEWVDTMCHCFKSVDELSEAEREELRGEHSVAELRAEYSEEELQKLGVAA